MTRMGSDPGFWGRWQPTGRGLDRGSERGTAALAVAVTLVVSVAVAAQQSPTFHADTRLVVLHVTVTNGHGELVTNLDRAAFRVDEDGRPQPITYPILE